MKRTRLIIAATTLVLIGTASAGAAVSRPGAARSPRMDRTTAHQLPLVSCSSSSSVSQRGTSNGILGGNC